MIKKILFILGFISCFVFGYYFNLVLEKSQESKSVTLEQSIKTKKETMKLGAFSVSLSVKDIEASKQFYEKLGFSVLAGNLEMNYLIMKNENSLIGLFQGMFDGNILTFNPGWDESGKDLENFVDIREIQQGFKSKGLKLDDEVDESESGPGSLMLTDPDGNVILIDQHR